MKKFTGNLYAALLWLAVIVSGTVRADGITTPGGCGPNGTAACQGTTITATTAFVVPTAADGTYANRTIQGTSTGISFFNAGMQFFAGADYSANITNGTFNLRSDGSITWQSNTAYNFALTRLALTRYADKQLMISGDGTGATTNAGLILGYAALSAAGGIWPTTNRATPDSTNFALMVRDSFTNINAGASGDTTAQIIFSAGGSGTKMVIPAIAGVGPSITAGTATSAVNALSITQTWNYNAAAITGILANFTDTSSHASTLLMDLQVGGASKFNVGKTGTVTTASYIAAGGAVYAGTDSTSGVQFGTAGNTTNLSYVSSGVIGVGTGAQGSFAGTLKLTTLQGGTTLTLNNASSGTLTIGSNAVTPASTGTRYLCISTAGVVTSSASACSGT